MARNKKNHHPAAVSSNFQVADKQVEGHNFETSDAFAAQGQSECQEVSMAPEVADTLTVPPVTAQEIWESLREEFYEQIEQLPLSLHRSFALVGEQDKEVQACQAELLPVIRSYVRLRQSIQLDAQCAETQAYGHGSQAHHRLSSRSSSVAPDPGIQLANTYVSGELGEQQPNGKLPSRVFPMHRTAHKEEDFDVTIDNVASQLSNSPQRGRAADLESKTTLQDTSNQNVNSRSQSGATRTQGVRETDATVPKSVPFPPRPKPKTTRELLTRISFLTGELLRASEEKLGLATAAYDSVDRHVRALDATIREHQDTTVPGLGECAFPVGKVSQQGNDAAINEEEGDDDDEPQLGMIGPLAETDGSAAPRLRRNRKRDRRDQQKHIVNMHAPTQAHASSIATHQESVDPHEPRYCYCNQVSYGEMIACDNADCSREWFHLGCVGLAAPPKGKVKWYCRDCEELMGSNRKRRIH